jgi:hypothetical protein
MIGSLALRRILGLSALSSVALLLPLPACGGDDAPDDGAGGASSGGGSSGGASSGGATTSGASSSGTGGAVNGAGGEQHGSGSAQCLALGMICHGVDDGDGPLAECHDIGHIGEPSACAEHFDDCITMCIEAAEGHGEGGAGHGGAGGEAPHHPETSDLCTFLGSFCHEVDDGDGPLHECHELGHDGDAAECQERAAECVTMCAAAMDGHGGAGGHGGADH